MNITDLEPEPEPEQAAELPWTEVTLATATKDELIAFMRPNCKPEFLSQHKLTGKDKVVAKYVKKVNLSVLKDVYMEILAEPTALIGNEPEPEPEPEM
jgi:hypothetical protein